MLIRDIVKLIDEFAPFRYQEEWDNSGFLIGDGDYEADSALIALDLDRAVADEAIARGADVIVTHHPYFMELKNITGETQKGGVILDLVRNNISLICAHTNLDAAKGGVNDILCEMLELENVRHLAMIDGEVGAIRYGEYSGKTAAQVIDIIKNKLGVNTVRYSGNPSDAVKRVCVCSGSGSSFLDEALSSGADTFITGDVKYHTFGEARELGLRIIDAGHFETENIICVHMRELLSPHMDAAVSESFRGFYKCY